MGENENFIHNKYGYCYYSVEPDSAALIYNLYVEPDYRRKGHAKDLIRFVVREIRESGYNAEIQIEVRPREDSIDTESLATFYKGMGLVLI